MTTGPGNEEADLDRTDELPVLSEESIVEMERQEATARHHRPTGQDSDAVGEITAEMERPSEADRHREVSRLEDEVEELKARWTRIESMLGDGSSSLDRLRSELDGTRRALADSLATEQDLRAELARSKSADSTLSERVDRAESEARDHATRAAGLESRVSELHDAVESARRDAVAQAAELDTARTRIRALEADLGQTAAEAAVLGKRVTELETELAGVRTERDEAVAAAETARDAANRLEAPDSTLLNRIAELEAYIAGRRDHWQEMEATVADREARIREMEQELRYRVGEQEALTGRLDIARAEAEEFRRQATEAIALARAQTEPGPASEDVVESSPGAAGRIEQRIAAAEVRVQEVEQALTGADSATAAKSGAHHPAAANAAGQPPPARAALIGLTSDTAPRHDIVADATTIGRGTDCDIRIPTHFVSRLHAVLRRESGEIVIEDQGSTNGVFVNSVRVGKTALHDGDWVTIGETQFRFVLETEATQ